MKNSDIDKLFAPKQTKFQQEHGYLAAATSELYELGVTLNELSTLLQISRTAARNMLKREGVSFRPPGPRSDPIDPNQVRQILKRHRIDIENLPHVKKRTREK